MKWGCAYLADLARRVEETLEDVREEDARAERDAHALDGFHDGTDDVGRRLKAVRPDEVHEVHHRVFASESRDAEREVLDDRAGRLSMHQVSVRQRVLEHRHDRVDVVGRLRPDVLEHEGERLETARAHVQLCRAVLVQDRGYTRKRPACLRDDRDGDGAADAGLPLLHAQVRKQDRKHVLWTQTLGDVAERVDGRTSDALFVCLEEVKELETDTHPLAGWHKFSATIS